MHIVSKNCLVVVLMRNTTINKIPHQVYLHTFAQHLPNIFTHLHITPKGFCISLQDREREHPQDGGSSDIEHPQVPGVCTCFGLLVVPESELAHFAQVFRTHCDKYLHKFSGHILLFIGLVDKCLQGIWGGFVGP